MEDCTAERQVKTDTPEEGYLQHMNSLKYSPQTLLSHKNALKKFSLFLTAQNIRRVQDVTGEDLDRFRLFLVDEGFGSKSLNTYLTNILQFYNYLEKTHQIFINPASGLIIPKPALKLQHVPTEEDMETLLARPDTETPVGIRDRALIEVMYSTGVRLEEVVGIDIPDVDFKRKTIRVLGKGDKERMVPFGKKASGWLDDWVKEVRPELVKNKPHEPALFVGMQQGKRINPQTVSRLIRDYSVLAGITPVSSHAIRRACATHLLRGGAHPAAIQELLGHSTAASLRHYLRLTIEDIKKMHKHSKMGN